MLMCLNLSSVETALTPTYCTLTGDGTYLLVRIGVHALGILVIYCYLLCHGPVQEFDRACSGDSFMNHAREKVVHHRTLWISDIWMTIRGSVYESTTEVLNSRRFWQLWKLTNCQIEIFSEELLLRFLFGRVFPFWRTRQGLCTLEHRQFWQGDLSKGRPTSFSSCALLVFLLFRGAARVFFCPKPLSEALYLTVSSFQNNGLVRWPRSEMGSHSYWFDLEKRQKELPSLGLSRIRFVLLCGKVWVHHLDWSTFYLRRETLVQLQKECD